MGENDSAEATDLVGLYLLHKFRNEDFGIQSGCYRDDWLGLSDLSNQDTEEVKKKICDWFKKENNLDIEINAINAKTNLYLSKIVIKSLSQYKNLTTPSIWKVLNRQFFCEKMSEEIIVKNRKSS